jgi:hypothetical protein
MEIGQCSNVTAILYWSGMDKIGPHLVQDGTEFRYMPACIRDSRTGSKRYSMLKIMHVSGRPSLSLITAR